ncbi:MAG TPA: RNA 2',3'-cyclic phosphodiesterase [Blastocatellia bacterium]|nr:RNA 2',3'-cyclic phosphodiesterase [Blastocatellia bacterium]
MSTASRSGRDEQRDSIRSFVSIEIPEPIRERIGALGQSLKRAGGQASWVKPANIHLTLKFLGDVARARIDAAKAGLERAAAGVHPIEIEVGGAGCFPSPRNPRVLWVGLASLPAELIRLHKRIEDELAREGFLKEQSRFSPHLTIARLRSPANSAELAESLIARGFANEQFTASRIILMQSQLSAGGSIYTPLAAIDLPGDAPADDRLQS